MISVYNQYCTSDDLLDVYPNIDEYDTKSPIYGFEDHDLPNMPGLPGRDVYISYNSGYVKSLFVGGKDQGEPARTINHLNDTHATWYYSEEEDFLVIYSKKNLNENIVEKGDNWNNLKTKIIQKASRFFDSRVDANISREQFRDKNGEFDYIVVRTTALIACKFLISGYDPESVIALSFDEEINFNIDLINSGKAKLSHQVSSDSSQGIVRIIQLRDYVKNINLVDTRGNYTGKYDIIKVICTTGGVIGTAKIDVYHGDSTNGIKSNKVLEGEIVTGLYQTIGNGLEVRFQGGDIANIMTEGDEWEIEAWGKGEEINDLGSSNILVTKMTRGGRGYK